MYKIPENLESVLLSYIKRTYLPKGHANPKTADQFTYHDIKFFARGAAEMSAYFTSERAYLTKNYLNRKELRAGYLLYFVMTNFLKVKFCLEQVGAGNDTPIRILDLGCGPGTAALACADHFRERKIEVTAIDQNTHSLHDAKHLFAEYVGEGLCPLPPLLNREGTEPLPYKKTSLKTVYADLHPKNISAVLKTKFDIIIAANFLSELGDVDKQAKIVETLIQRHLAPNGVIIIIEPALRWTTRNLMKLRDQIIGHRPLSLTLPLEGGGKREGVTILSPCLHSSICPMLKENNRDWCHMYLDWQRPKVIEEVDKLIGNRKDYLKFSYLILTNPEPQTPSPKPRIPNPELWRAVSSPMRSKGKIEILLCGQDGQILRATRQDKNISENNQDLDNTMRGDLIETDSRGAIEKTTKFRKTPGTHT